jgi:hypothetical protein
MKKVTENYFPASVFQRAGYFAEQIVKNERLTAVFETKLASINYQTAYLKAHGAKKGEKNITWNLFINANIEIDL